MLSCVLLLAACGGGAGTGPPSDTNVSTGERVTPSGEPADAPAGAQAVEETVALGRIERRAGGQAETIDTRRFENAFCQDGIIVFETSHETIYAARSCDGFWSAEAGEVFVGAEVAVVLEVTERRFAVLIETVEGAQAEFTVDGIWVE